MYTNHELLSDLDALSDDDSHLDLRLPEDEDLWGDVLTDAADLTVYEVRTVSVWLRGDLVATSADGYLTFH